MNLNKPILDLLIGGNLTLKLNQLAFSRKDCTPDPLEDYSVIILQQDNPLNLNNQTNQT